MSFQHLNSFPQASEPFQKRLQQFQKLLDILAKRELPSEIQTYINTQIAAVNALEGQEKKDSRQLRKHQQAILNRLTKELKLVPKNHYRTQWMVLGLSAFGIPIGAAFGLSLGNMAFLGTGLPLGMVIGLAVGSSMDQKAAKEGRQLDFTVKP